MSKWIAVVIGWSCVVGCGSDSNPPAASGSAGSGGAGDAAGSTSGGAGGTAGSTSGGAGGTAGSMGGGGSSGSGGSMGGSAGSADIGIFATAGSEALALTEFANATNGNSTATVQASFTNGGTSLRSMTVYISANGPIGPGMFTCATGNAGVIYQPMLGQTYTAGAMMGSCAITATSVGKASGEITEGTFEATVAPLGDAGAAIVITGGRFKATVK